MAFQLRKSPVRFNLAQDAPSTQQSAQTSSRGGFLSSLIGEAGGTGGALGGAALGTAILPGIGTLAGALLGGFAGGAGGQAIENQVRDGRVDTGKALQEGALSGVFGAGPLRLLGTGGRAAAGVLRGGGSLSDELVKAGAQATQRGVASQVGQKALSGSDNLVAKQFRLNPSQQFNFFKKHNEKATDVLRRFSINSADEVTTKGIQPLQNAFDDIAESIPNISKKALQTELKKAYTPLLKSPVLAKQALGKQLQAQSDEIVKSFGDEVPASVLNDLRREFDEVTNFTLRGDPTHTAAERAGNSLRELLRKEADNAGLTFQGKTFREVGQDLNKLRELAEYTGKQEFLGSGSLPFGLTGLLGGGVGAAAGGPLGAAGGVAATELINSSGARRAYSKLGQGVGNKLAGSNPLAVGGVGSRVGGANLAQALAQSIRPTDSTAPSDQINSLNPADSSGSSNTYSYTNASMGGPNLTNSNASTMPPAISNISQLDTFGGEMSSDNSLASALSDPTVQQQLLLADLLDPNSEGSNIPALTKIFELTAQAEPKPLNATQQQQSTNALSALNDLSMIESEVARDPSVAGKASLPFDSLSNRFTGAGEFESAKNNIVDALARLRSGAAITDFEFENFSRLLPQTFDSPELVQSKVARLRDLFTRFANPTPAPDLAESLVGAQATQPY